MSLLSLPNELLLLIAESLTCARDICCLIFTNRRFCHLLAPSLLRYATQKEYAMTALFYAAAAGNRALIRLILEFGPPLMVLGHIRDRIGAFGIRVIYSAPMRCADEAVDRILSIGPGIQLTRLWEGQASPRALLPPALTHGTFHGTFPALHWGVLQGHYHLVKLLLAKTGVDVNARIRTSLNRWGYRDHDDAYSHECGPNRRVYRRHFAPAEFNVAPLHLAAYLGHQEIVELLLDSGAETGTVATYDSKTELHLAAQMGHEGVVRVLLERGGAEVDLQDGCGWHPLFGAVMFGHEPMVALLLEHGADTNLIGSGLFKQWSGRTLLHFLVLRDEIRPYRAWSGERRSILGLLLEAGADPTIPDRCGESVYQLAQRLGDKDLEWVLSENYLWYGARYWESTRSRGALRRESQRLYVRWKLRRWCKDGQDVALRKWSKTCEFFVCCGGAYYR